MAPTDSFKATKRLNIFAFVAHTHKHEHNHETEPEQKHIETIYIEALFNKEIQTRCDEIGEETATQIGNCMS